MSEQHDLKKQPKEQKYIHTFIMAAPVIRPESPYKEDQSVLGVWHQINRDHSLFQLISCHLEASTVTAFLFSLKWTCPFISGLHQYLCKSHIRTFPFAGSEHQRCASGQTPGLLTHREAACLWASLSGATRLKTLSLWLCSACTLWVIVSRTDWTLLSHNCCMLHMLSMLFFCLPTAGLSPVLQVKLKSELMKYLKSSNWALQRSAFLSLWIGEKLQVQAKVASFR